MDQFWWPRQAQYMVYRLRLRLRLRLPLTYRALGLAPRLGLGVLQLGVPTKS